MSTETLRVPSHQRVHMAGRDPHERGRAATPLELLYDLVFVVGLGTASGEFAHSIAAGHWVAGLGAFLLVVWAITWAWITFTAFASAYDTDDWAYRLLAMVQMAGVAILTLGIAPVFASFDHPHEVFDNAVMVAGYVVMRVPLLLQYLRAARRDRGRRTQLLWMAGLWSLAQIGWTVTVVTQLTLTQFAWAAVPLFLLELAGLRIVERKGGLPWHPEHLAERFGLLTIISLGEVVVGTVGALQVLVSAGWGTSAVALLAAGVVAVFGLWWLHFLIPYGLVLERRRGYGLLFQYLHIPLWLAIAGVGAVLHVVAYAADPEHAGFAVHVSDVQVVAGVALAVVAALLVEGALYVTSVRTSGRYDGFHLVLWGGAIAIALAGVLAVTLGLPRDVGILVAALAPAVVVLGYELKGHEHLQDHLHELGVGRDAER